MWICSSAPYWDIIIYRYAVAPPTVLYSPVDLRWRPLLSRTAPLRFFFLLTWPHTLDFVFFSFFLLIVVFPVDIDTLLLRYDSFFFVSFFLGVGWFWCGGELVSQFKTIWPSWEAEGVMWRTEWWRKRDRMRITRWGWNQNNVWMKKCNSYEIISVKVMK